MVERICWCGRELDNAICEFLLVSHVLDET